MSINRRRVDHCILENDPREQLQGYTPSLNAYPRVNKTPEFLTNLSKSDTRLL